MLAETLCNPPSDTLISFNSVFVTDMGVRFENFLPAQLHLASSVLANVITDDLFDSSNVLFPCSIFPSASSLSFLPPFSPTLSTSCAPFQSNTASSLQLCLTTEMLIVARSKASTV